MTTYAITRDWDSFTFIPVEGDYIQLRKDQIVECEQPDELDGEEFNLILKFPGGKTLRARSIDFEFFEEMDEFSAESDAHKKEADAYGG